MPLDASFKQRAEHNERLLSEFDLATTPYLDWAVVIAFYAAVRYVDAYFQATPSQRPVDHAERLRRVAQDAKTRPIVLAYRELYNRSRDARYELVAFTPTEVRRLVANQLGQVKTHMLRQ